MVERAFSHLWISTKGYLCRLWPRLMSLGDPRSCRRKSRVAEVLTLTSGAEGIAAVLAVSRLGKVLAIEQSFIKF
jgi:hypothetical protein